MQGCQERGYRGTDTYTMCVLGAFFWIPVFIIAAGTSFLSGLSKQCGLLALDYAKQYKWKWNKVTSKNARHPQECWYRWTWWIQIPFVWPNHNDVSIVELFLRATAETWNNVGSKNFVCFRLSSRFIFFLIWSLKFLWDHKIYLFSTMFLFGIITNEMHLTMLSDMAHRNVIYVLI